MILKAHREALKVREGYWFAPKLYGYGATPATWQGWVATLVFGIVLGVAIGWAPTNAIRIGIGIPVVIGFLYVAWQKTDGEWRWRWGPDRK